MREQQTSNTAALLIQGDNNSADKVDDGVTVEKFDDNHTAFMLLKNRAAKQNLTSANLQALESNEGGTTTNLQLLTKVKNKSEQIKTTHDS
jgi:FlaG/FlaF family flagellin (archaellin)